MKCSCAALAGLLEALYEAKRRGTAPDGRPIAREINMQLIAQCSKHLDQQIASCAYRDGVSLDDVRDRVRGATETMLCCDYRTP